MSRSMSLNHSAVQSAGASTPVHTAADADMFKAGYDHGPWLSLVAPISFAATLVVICWITLTSL